VREEGVGRVRGKGRGEGNDWGTERAGFSAPRSAVRVQGYLVNAAIIMGLVTVVVFLIYGWPAAVGTGLCCGGYAAVRTANLRAEMTGATNGAAGGGGGGRARLGGDGAVAPRMKTLRDLPPTFRGG
jgi:hypothetical protein